MYWDNRANVLCSCRSPGVGSRAHWTSAWLWCPWTRRPTASTWTRATSCTTSRCAWSRRPPSQNTSHHYISHHKARVYRGGQRDDREHIMNRFYSSSPQGEEPRAVLHLGHEATSSPALQEERGSRSQRLPPGRHSGGISPTEWRLGKYRLE